MPRTSPAARFARSFVFLLVEAMPARAERSRYRHFDAHADTHAAAPAADVMSDAVALPLAMQRALSPKCFLKMPLRRSRARCLPDIMTRPYPRAHEADGARWRHLFVSARATVEDARLLPSPSSDADYCLPLKRHLPTSAR